MLFGYTEASDLRQLNLLIANMLISEPEFKGEGSSLILILRIKIIFLFKRFVMQFIENERPDTVYFIHTVCKYTVTLVQ